MTTLRSELLIELRGETMSERYFREWFARKCLAAAAVALCGMLALGFVESLRLPPQKTVDGKEIEYGMGWFIHKSKSGQRVYEHSGGSVGGTSHSILYPDAHVVVAMVCNFDGGWGREDIEKVGEAFEKK